MSVNDAATKKVADYWGGLVTEGAISGNPMYTPEWNKSLNDGTIIAWPSAVWGPACWRQRARHQGQVGNGAAAAVVRR